uniref:Peptidase A2 domain-containing protein n=1 Tax=Anopheles quadriannulatus TaxID=34691 RepID=A0A182XPZ7_ANOQN
MRVGCAVARIGSVSVHIGPTNVRIVEGTNVATFVVNINVCNVEARRKYVHILINGRPTKLQLDTASDITVISEGLWKDIGQPSLIRATVKAKAASQ